MKKRLTSRPSPALKDQVNESDAEPLWPLKGRDRLAPQTIRDWALRASRIQVSSQKIGSAMLDAAKIEQWQVRHGSKIPD